MMMMFRAYYSVPSTRVLAEKDQVTRHERTPHTQKRRHEPQTQDAFWLVDTKNTNIIFFGACVVLRSWVLIVSL